MRARIWKIIFLTVFALCRAAPPVMSFESLQVETQSVGLLSLPPEWRVVSKDETPEQNFVSDWILNVQQALYARTENIFAELQIFSIWGADLEGNEKPLPRNMFEINGNLVSALIGERYGNVSELGENIIETDLENLSVATYGVEFFPEGESRAEFRYKRASLYRGEKRVLVLLKYKPEFEDYWHAHFGAMLNSWVGSLTLTPTLAPAVALKLEASLPAPPPFLPRVTSETPPPADLQEQSPLQIPPSEQPSSGQTPRAPDGVVWPVSLLAAFLFFCVLFYRILRRNKKAPAEFAFAFMENDTEADAHATGKALPTFEEWLAEEPIVHGRPRSHVPPGATEVDGFDRVYGLLDQALNFIEGDRKK